MKGLNAKAAKVSKIAKELLIEEVKMAKTKIEWAERVWNPITGCIKVSPGCANCYAERMAKRLQAMGTRGYAGTVDDQGRWTGQVNLIEEAIRLPLTWKKPRRIFVNSMSDLFHQHVFDSTIDKIFRVMIQAKQHTFLILTKHPERMYRYFHDPLDDWKRIGDDMDRADRILEPGTMFPIPNVWLGVSVEDQQRADERVPWLLKTPAAVRFVSAEPLLGPVDLRTYTEPCSYYCDHGGMYPEGHHPARSKLDWVIVGGESGAGARPMRPYWARSLRDQCQAAGVPFFFKQWGGARPGGERLLDGREWSEFPSTNGFHE